MKYLIMTEGTCEKALIDVLLEKELLFVNEKDLLYEQIFHARQIKNSIKEMINQLPTNETIVIIRVGDKLSDKLEIDDDIKSRVDKQIDICIKPEFELLFILYKNKYSDYLKVKSTMKPCEYLKQVDNQYEKTYKYNYEFFNKLSDEEIKEIFKKYNQKRKSTHTKSSKTITYLINKEYM